jgi:hypothetical protein
MENFEVLGHLGEGGCGTNGVDPNVADQPNYIVINCMNEILQPNITYQDADIDTQANCRANTNASCVFRV